MKRSEIVKVPGNEDGKFWMPYSLGVVVEGGRTLYLAGMNAAPLFHSHPHIPSEFDEVPLDAAAQTEIVIASMRRVLEAAGGSLRDVVQMTVHVVDVAKNGDAVQDVTGKHFEATPPASTVVEVAGIITDPRMLVEITAIAVLEESA